MNKNTKYKLQRFKDCTLALASTGTSIAIRYISMNHDEKQIYRTKWNQFGLEIKYAIGMGDRNQTLNKIEKNNNRIQALQELHTLKKQLQTLSTETRDKIDESTITTINQTKTRIKQLKKIV